MLELKTVPDADRWVVRSRAAGQLNHAVIVMAASGTVAAACLVLLAIISGRATVGLSWLLLVALPTVLAGQLWMITWARQRQTDLVPGRRTFLRLFGGSPAAFFFGPLHRRVAWPLLGVAVCGWVAGMAAVNVLGEGHPGDPTPTCTTVLETRETVRCVSQQAWDRAEAAEQQMVGGLFMGFYALHTGAALGLRQARTAVARLAAPP